jgi:tripartite-type tricarboxylate transporter receptor subunit TctC
MALWSTGRTFRAASTIVVLGAALGTVSAADDIPSRPIRIIVSAAAGGNLDLTVRALAPRMSATLGQSFVIENRAGGNSLPATRIVKDMPGDGLTLLAMSNTFVISPNFILNTGYDPVKDFAPIGLMNRLPMLMVTSAKSSVKTFAAFIEAARRKDYAMSFASSGIGTATHLPAALLEQRAGIRMLHVPYKGNAPAIADIFAGRVDTIFDPISTSAPYVRDARFIALGISTPQRSHLMPEVPTIAEQGYPGFDFTVYTGLIAPAGTPPAALARLHDALYKATASAEIKEIFAKGGTDAFTHPSPEDFGEYIKVEVGRYAKLVKDANIKPTAE